MDNSRLIKNKNSRYSESHQEGLKVLGNYEDVVFCGDIYSQKSEMLFLITTDALLKFCHDNNFDSDTFAAFKKGLSVFPEFLKKCAEEVQMNELLNRKKTS